MGITGKVLFGYRYFFLCKKNINVFLIMICCLKIMNWFFFLIVFRARKWYLVQKYLNKLKTYGKTKYAKYPGGNVRKGIV